MRTKCILQTYVHRSLEEHMDAEQQHYIEMDWSTENSRLEKIRQEIEVIVYDTKEINIDRKVGS